MVIHIHIVVLVEGPVAVADDGVLTKQAHAYLIIGQPGIATQAIARLVLDVLLV